MINNIKRLLALLLVFALMIPCAVFAESDATEEPEQTETEAPAEEAAEETEPEPTYSGELVDVDDLMINEKLDDQGWWNILLLGADSRYAGMYGLTDSIIILSINPEKGAVKMTSIMRDTWVKIYGKGEQKINAANVYGGPELAMRTVNECFGMNISEYVLVNMQSLVNIIDIIGGITLPEVTQAEKSAINSQLQDDAADFKLNSSEELTEYGENIHLNGNQALAYARIRKLDSDYVRTQRQRNVLVAIASELKNESLVTITSVVSELYGYVETNLTIPQIISLAPVALNLGSDTIEQFRIPVDGTFASDTYNGIWQIRPNFETNTELLHDFIYGEGAADEETEAEAPAEEDSEEASDEE